MPQVQDAEAQELVFYKPKDLLATEHFNRIDRVLTEATFTPDYPNDELRVQDATVLLGRRDEGIEASIDDVTVELIPNAVNEIFLGVQSSIATVLATDQGEPLWSAQKIGEVDTSEETSSTVSPHRSVLMPGDVGLDGFGIFDQEQAEFQALADSPAHTEGKLFYNEKNRSFSYYNEQSNVEISVGQEEIVRARNREGATVPNGTPVYISGAAGINPEFQIAGPQDFLKRRAVGLVTHNIPDDEFGYITTQGLVRGLDTSDFSDGEVLYVDGQSGEAGVDGVDALTGVEPTYPDEQTRVGFCMQSHPSDGAVLVSIAANGNEIRRAEAEPGDPPPGEAIEWLSNGTGAGNDGDLMLKITDSGGTTKTITQVDFSAQ